MTFNYLVQPSCCKSLQRYANFLEPSADYFTSYLAAQLSNFQLVRVALFYHLHSSCPQSNAASSRSKLSVAQFTADV